jgi:hypothetical protein
MKPKLFVKISGVVQEPGSFLLEQLGYSNKETLNKLEELKVGESLLIVDSNTKTIKRIH